MILDLTLAPVSDLVHPTAIKSKSKSMIKSMIKSKSSVP
jgi:hypothetical protein